MKNRISDQTKLITKKWYKDSEFILKESKKKNTGQKIKSDMKIVTDFFRPGYNPFL
jgi:hypothetical protein